MKRAPAPSATRACSAVSTVPAPTISSERPDSSAITRGASGTVKVISSSVMPPRATASAADRAASGEGARITAISLCSRSRRKGAGSIIGCARRAPAAWAEPACGSTSRRLYQRRALLGEWSVRGPAKAEHRTSFGGLGHAAGRRLHGSASHTLESLAVPTMTAETSKSSSTPPRRGRVRRFWRRVTDGLEAQQLWDQFRSETRASYELYRKEVDWQTRAKERRMARGLRIAGEMFW